ncbi:MAG: PQQ-binding-like beta-propeller repeat protein [Planctomycetes bacterium]|nr:PQQ-binding-like beta-propeller repeat protein [Planctomycetota bacterium]
MGKRTAILITASLVCTFWLVTSLAVQAPTPEEQAQSILDAAGVKGGLIVHLGCGDGRLTAALCRGPAYQVHGLDTDVRDIEEARRRIRASGRYGQVSVEQWEGTRLPYGDNLVNLLVTEDLGQIPMREVRRVLVPQGVAFVKQGKSPWVKEIKPRPQNVDEWTHFLHDPSGNAVAHDEVVGPPRYTQWIAEPRHTRSHEHTPSIAAVVSAQGRICYLADEGPVASLRQPPRWHLVARDAYNGIQLWQRSFTGWFPYLISWGAAPPQLQRRMVLIGDRLYVTLGLHAPVSVVDAATGKTIRIHEQTEGTEEIVCHQGVLLLAVREVTKERAAELAKWPQLAEQKKSPIHVRETAQPLVDGFRSTENKAPKSVLALDAETGRLLWKKTGAEASGLRPLSLCAEGDRVFYQNGKDAVCLDLKTGQEQWSSPAAGLKFVFDGRIVCVEGQTITALSAATGRTQWTQPSVLVDTRDVFVAGGSLWLGGFKPFPQKRGPAWGPYFAVQHDLSTGKLLRQIEPENLEHHHRCYQNKATDRYILAGRRGVEFFDLASGEMREHSWVRGVCRYGVMPCNGLLYAPPHACACYIGTKINGFFALAAQLEPGGSVKAEGLGDESTASKEDHRQAAPDDATLRALSVTDWPTYRHDAERSGGTRVAVAAVLKPKWQMQPGGRLSSLTVADGKVFVAAVERHEVLALDADSGALAWAFTAGGRVDSPPTICGDRALFGSRDGAVYSVQTSDGTLAWRFEGVRPARRVMAYGQLESTLPAYGSVLVQGGVACVTMGRSSYLDGGIDLYRLDPRSGRMLSRTPVYSPDPETGRQPRQFAPYAMPGVRADILSGDGDHIYLRDVVFDRQGATQAQGRAHLFTLTDFLDDAWAHRSYWIFGTHCTISGGCSTQEKGLIFGRLLAFDGATIYGYGRTRLHWSNQLQDGPYRLFATKRDETKPQWEKALPIQVRAMVLADQTLFVAGPTMSEDRPQSSTPGAQLLAVATSDGAVLASYRLEAGPVFDGMGAVAGRLYLTLENGSVVCMEESR